MIAIKFENISKQYQLGTIGTGTLSHDLNRWWQMNIRGKEDPYLKVGQFNTLASKEKEGFIWALRDINLRVEQGDVLGIIGKNGAGKSTLLKLLSRVTAPTTGRIRAWGRVASLLEVGTGFHPEMTGRENIYMNGSIMGMTKAEINRKFDEIVDFAGVERYIDTPVKRYSSGMTVRLGFAIAAHLEPEILVVDEVLAVGDAEFQKKAIGKMQDISTGLGRTILFVSHNMGILRNLCRKGILLQDGAVINEDRIDVIVNQYLSEAKAEYKRKVKIEAIHRKTQGFLDIEILEVELLNNIEIATNEPIRLNLVLRVNNKKQTVTRIVGMLNTYSGYRVGLFFSEHFSLPTNTECFEVNVVLSNHNLAKGQYYFDFNLGKGDPVTGVTDFDSVYNTVSFEVVYDDYVSKATISKWAPNWGHISFKDVVVSFNER